MCDHEALDKSRSCSAHGVKFRRRDCAECNAAYMRAYLRKRRVQRPAVEMFHRAKKRAARIGVPFSLTHTDIVIPSACPVLGGALQLGATRTGASPSLDRVDPSGGYVAGNVRVISDRANKLKGARGLGEVRRLAAKAGGARSADYAAIAHYMEREALLREVRLRASKEDDAARQWSEVAAFLERAFARSAFAR